MVRATLVSLLAVEALVGLTSIVSTLDLTYSSSGSPHAAAAVASDVPAPPSLDAEEVRALGAIPLVPESVAGGFISMLPEKPDKTGIGLTFQRVTILAWREEPVGRGLWILFAVPGAMLNREATGDRLTDTDGATRPPYLYRGFAGWMFLVPKGSYPLVRTFEGNQDVSSVAGELHVGGCIGFAAGLDQGPYDMPFNGMNRAGLAWLDGNVGRTNLGIAPVAFKADFVYIDFPGCG